MKILELVHTPLQYDPPIFNLGKQLQIQGHHIVMVGYWLPQLESYETIAPGYEIIRIDRGDWGFLPRLLRGGLRFLKYSLKAKAIYSQFIPDLVIATNFDSLSLGHLLKNKDVPILYYCNEYSNKPDFRYYLTGWGFLKVFEPIFVRKSNFVVSVDANRARLQAKDWGRRVDGIILNAPLYDDKFEEQAINWIENRNAEEIRIVYAGSIDKRNLLEEFMEIASGIPYVNFHIYGRVVDGYRDTFFTGLEKFRLISSNRINYMGTIPYVDLPVILMQYDIGVCFYDKSVINTVYASPAKIFEYMKAGLIIFSTDQPTPQKIIDTLNGGYIYHDDRFNETVTVLQDLYNDRQKVIELRKANLKSFCEEYNYTKQARELFDWINSL